MNKNIKITYGLGYVGLPLSLGLKKFRTIGFDISKKEYNH